MNWPWVLLAVAVVLALIFLLFLLWGRASRLDRLHRKVVATRVALDGQLLRRAIAASELATSALLDPASAVLVAGASYAVIDLGDDTQAPASSNGQFALDGLSSARESLESELSATVRQALDDDEIAAIRATTSGAEMLDHLAAAWYRAQLARRFHNDAVFQAQRARRHWWVRLFRLAGNAPMPGTAELDDQLPDSLASASQTAREAAATPRT